MHGVAQSSFCFSYFILLVKMMSYITELSPRRTGGDRDSRSWGKVDVIHHATHSPPGGAR